MGTAAEVQQAVEGLSVEELAKFRDWFARFDAEAWDRQFEDDVLFGRLDALADEAIKEKRQGGNGAV